jgi:hypothetical protein
MPQNIRDVIENCQTINESPSSIATILDFERVLDEMDLYAYAHWMHGELVQGPVYEKYFVTCTFMWPYKKMPDPRGAERLMQYGCEVSYKQDLLEVPVKIKTPYDFKAGTKFAKSTHYKIWLVTIVMPRDLMSNIEKGTIEIENESLDMEDIEEAYEEGTDEDENGDESQENGDQQGQEEQGAAGISPMSVPGQAQLPTQGGM